MQIRHSSRIILADDEVKFFRQAINSCRPVWLTEDDEKVRNRLLSGNEIVLDVSGALIEQFRRIVESYRKELDLAKLDIAGANWDARDRWPWPVAAKIIADCRPSMIETCERAIKHLLVIDLHLSERSTYIQLSDEFCDHSEEALAEGLSR